MTLPSPLQPDQLPCRWDDHVPVYEAAFEPLTNAFAAKALADLNVGDPCRLIDIGAGAGGGALMAAARGGEVLAVDASPAMASRIASRYRHGPTSARTGSIQAICADGAALPLPEACVDAALSVFGIVLFPDAEAGIREVRRVLRPGGRLAIVTWTAIERYELTARLMQAAASVRGPQPSPGMLPAQLRYRERAALASLLENGGLEPESIESVEHEWRLPSARWIADRMCFAPGMSAMLDGFGAAREAILQAFVETLELERGRGPITLSAVAFVGIACKPGGAE